jgi:amino acid permease
MTTKALMKAMGFMFIPTFSVLTLIFFWFLSWTEFVAFITSKSGWAGFLRMVLLLAEIALVWFFYTKYNEQDVIDNAVDADVKEMKRVSGETRAYNVNVDMQRLINQDRAHYDVYRTTAPNIFILKVEKITES